MVCAVPGHVAIHSAGFLYQVGLNNILVKPAGI